MGVTFIGVTATGVAYRGKVIAGVVYNGTCVYRKKLIAEGLSFSPSSIGFDRQAYLDEIDFKVKATEEWQIEELL